MRSNNHTPPEYKKRSFHCPHCNVFASQTWINDGSIIGKFLQDYFGDLPIFDTDDLTIRNMIDGAKANCLSIASKYYCLAECLYCGKFSIWVDKEIIYSFISTAQPPHKNMPETVRETYEEARSVAQLSPRSAAVLLRVTLEMLVIVLKKTKKERLHKVIGRLQKQGLSDAVVETLKSVTTITNEGGSHAGKIDLRSENDLMVVDQLFFAVNYIVEEVIAHHNRLVNLKKLATKSYIWQKTNQSRYVTKPGYCEGI